MDDVLVLHVDNRWKPHDYNPWSKRSDDPFCCWYLRLTQNQFPSKDNDCGSQYTLHYLQISDGNTLFITFQLTVLSSSTSEFRISPDSGYLLCFGRGCNFLKLPDIYNDIKQNNLSTIKSIDAYYKCNEKKNPRNLFQLLSFPTISTAHFIDDQRLIFYELYNSSIPRQASCQRMFVMNLKSMEMEMKKMNKLNKSGDTNTVTIDDVSDHELSVRINHFQEQYLTSGYGLIVFADGVGLKIYKMQQNQSNVIGTDSIHSKKEEAKLIGQKGWKKKKKISTRSRTFRENSQLVKREYDGMNKDKYWLIAFSEDMHHSNLYRNRNKSLDFNEILIFDVSTCELHWVIHGNKFKMGLEVAPSVVFTKDTRPQYKRFRLFCCSYGVVVFRTFVHHYGDPPHNRIEADLALHPVPFWDHEQIRKIVRPHVSYLSYLVDIVMSYSGSRSVDDAEIASHLRYIPGNALVKSDGLRGIVFMASHWDTQQLKRIRDTLVKKGSGKKGKGDIKQVVFRANWEQLMMHQQPPGLLMNGMNPFRPFGKANDPLATHSGAVDSKQATLLQSFDDVSSGRGSYLHLVQQLYDQPQ